MLLAVLLAAAAWQAEPLVVIDDGNPVLCGYRYRDNAGAELRVEKGVRAGGVFTAVEYIDGTTRGAVSDLQLRTHSFDSQRDLAAVAAAPNRIRLEGDLQAVDAGGALFAELAVSGGQLRVTYGSAAAPTETESVVELPAPLPRGVSAMYLNCAGDLIRPE